MDPPSQLMEGLGINYMIRFEKIALEECMLGEGISISADGEYITWVDILGNKVFCYSNLTNALEVKANWDNPSCTFQDASEWVYVSHNGGIDRFSKLTGSHEHCVSWFGHNSNLRCNDGKMDRFGNIWISTMSKSLEENRGAIWKWDKLSSPIIVKNGLTIPNSICVDESRRKFYYCDTPKNRIYVDRLDSNRIPMGCDEIFFDGGDIDGLPDGSAIDDSGCLWNTRWDGSCIVKISRDGDVLKTLATPFPRPTSLVFLGSNNFFVTSASGPTSSDVGITYRVSI